MWKMMKLGEVIEKTETINPELKFPNESFEYIDVSSVNNERLVIEETQTLFGKDAPSRARRKVQENDIIFATVRPTLKRVAVVPKELDGQICSTGYIVLRGKKDVLLPRYLFYWMTSHYVMKYVESIQTGASYPAVTDKQVKDIDIRIPSIAEQQRIVAKLDAAFAAIDEALLSINHKRILAEQLVSRTISSVFSQIDDNELEHTTLGEVTYTAGRIGWKGLTKKEYVEEGRLFLSVHGLNYGKFVDFRDAFRITQARYDESPEIMLKQGDILLCKDGAGIGKLGVVGKLPEPATINSSLLLIRPSEQLTTDYIYYSLLSSEFQSVIQSKIDGATTPHLYQRDINQFQFSLPSLQIQKEITEKISSTLLEIQKIQNSFASNIKNYETLKKALLAQELQPNKVT